MAAELWKTCCPEVTHYFARGKAETQQK